MEYYKVRIDDGTDGYHVHQSKSEWDGQTPDVYSYLLHREIR